MGTRLELQAELLDICDDVYFQQPPSKDMKYPCIIYRLDDVKTEYADNKPYSHDRSYLLTVIDRSPDSVITKQIEALPKCSFDRFYTADKLNHFVYKLFF